MLSLPVPVQVSLSLENFSTLTKQFFGWFNLSNLMDLLVFRQVGMPLETFATNVAFKGRFSGVNSDVLPQLIW